MEEGLNLKQSPIQKCQKRVFHQLTLYCKPIKTNKMWDWYFKILTRWELNMIWISLLLCPFCFQTQWGWDGRLAVHLCGTAGEDAHCGQQPTLISVGFFFLSFFVRRNRNLSRERRENQRLVIFLQSSCQNIPAMLQAQYATAKRGQNVCLKYFQDKKKGKNRKRQKRPLRRCGR